MISITAFGRVPVGQMVRRIGATVGDHVVVSGTIGDAALGLAALRGGPVADALAGDAGSRDVLVSRYRVPQPRSALATAVRDHASASMDVSDGLAGDLTKLLATSGVAATVVTAAIPLSTAAASLLRHGTIALPALLAGGDDYEILCTIPPARLASFIEDAGRAGVAVSAIGTVSAGTGARFVDAQGRELILSRMSYSHF